MRINHLLTCFYGNLLFAAHLNHGRGVASQRFRSFEHYALVYLVSGSGVYRDDRGAFFNLRSGSIWLVRPGLSHFYGPEMGQTWEEIFFVFNGEVGRVMESYCELNAQPVVGLVKGIKKMENRCKDLLHQYALSKQEDAFYLLSQLQLLLADAYRHLKKAKVAGEESIRRGMLLIAQNVSYDLDLYRLAEELNLGYESFRKRFTEVCGLAPRQYIQKVLMEKAGDLLLEKGASVKSVAEKLRFCNEFHFSKQFKKWQGVAPKQYQKMMANLMGKE